MFESRPDRRTGGGNAPPERKEVFGQGKPNPAMRRIDTNLPFELRASADGQGMGGLTVRLIQEADGGHRSEVTVFDKGIAGNPQGSSVPASAAIATAAAIEATGGLALVASLWTAEDLSWLTGHSCDTPCDIKAASFTISR